MAKFHLVNEPDTGKIWLLNLETQTADQLDLDVLHSLGVAGNEFIELITGSGENLQTTADRRSDPSERLSSASPTTMGETREHRSMPSDRSYFFNLRNVPLDRSLAANSSAVN
ncbi:hypothetical protein [Phyllobacterium sp. SB3]|uniref:hypothetical protein n=1 Tax=Phyllobacterium sp. SB3 TaxID=3156073 RepID=UPI0032B00579